MKIAIDNQQKCQRPDLPTLKRLASWLMARPGADPAGGAPWASLLIVLTDDAGMRALHARWMGSETDTDVLSGHYEALPGEPPGRSAEIVINVERAARLGPRLWARSRGTGNRRQAGARELALYLAHGCDHLRGADDATATEQRRMRRRELRWLREAQRLGLLKGLLLAP